MPAAIATLNLEDIATLSDDDLISLGHIARMDMAKVKQQSERIEGELLRRLRNKKAEQLTSPLGRVTLTQAQAYRWDVERARAVLAPHMTPDEEKKAFREKEPEPPPPVEVTVHSQSARAIARKAGEEVTKALEECFELVPKGAPKLSFDMFDRAPDPDEEEIL